MIVERTDFITVPVTDMERSKRFYGETLGLAQVEHAERQGFPEYQLGENISLYLLDMKSVGSDVHRAAHRDIALRVPDVEPRRDAELEAKGVAFDGDTLDTTRLSHGVLPRSRRECVDAASPLRALGMTTLTRDAGREAVRRAAAAVDHRRALALHRPARLRPATRWQVPPFTGVGHCKPAARPRRRRRARVVTESGIEIVSAPAGVRFELAAARTTRRPDPRRRPVRRREPRALGAWSARARRRRTSSSRSPSTCR